jgi:hypothetical protein
LLNKKWLSNIWFFFLFNCTHEKPFSPQHHLSLTHTHTHTHTNDEKWTKNYVKRVWCSIRTSADDPARICQEQHEGRQQTQLAEQFAHCSCPKWELTKVRRKRRRREKKICSIVIACDVFHIFFFLAFARTALDGVARNNKWLFWKDLFFYYCSYSIRTFATDKRSGMGDDRDDALGSSFGGCWNRRTLILYFFPQLYTESCGIANMIYTQGTSINGF